MTAPRFFILVLTNNRSEILGDAIDSALAQTFHGSQTLTTGEGGMLVTNREDIHKRAAFLNDLPSGLSLTPEEVKRGCEALKRALSI